MTLICRHIAIMFIVGAFERKRDGPSSLIERDNRGGRIERSVEFR